MNTVAPISVDELHAYVDRTLGEEDRREVKSYLNNHGDTAEMVRAYAAQNAALHQYFAQRSTNRSRSAWRAIEAGGGMGRSSAPQSQSCC